jgi:hypothetical protein
MIIGLVGLHGCGKSHLSKILEKEFGWINVNKRRLLEEMFSKNFSSSESQESIDWYRHMYRSYGAPKIMELILEKIPRGTPVILDAIHNPREWSIVKSTFHKSMLAGVFAPHAIRVKRNNPQDALLDIKRMKYWHDHDDESSECLMSEVEWVFNGVHSYELQKSESKELMNYLKASKYLV